MADDNRTNTGSNTTVVNAIGFDAVVQRMKAEGQLLRNSGTNSIKSLKEEMEVQSDLQSRLLTSFESYFSKIAAHYEWVQDNAAKAEADRLQQLAELRSKMGAPAPEVVKESTPADDSSKDLLLGGLLGAGLVGSLAAAVGTAIAGALAGVGAAYGALSPGQITGIGKALNTAFLKPVMKVIDWAKNLPKVLGNTYTKWFGELEKRTFVKDLDKVDEVEGPRQSLLNKIQRYVDGVKKKINGITKSIGEWIGKKFKWVGELKQGVKDLFPEVGKVSEVAQATDDVPKDPSKLVTWIKGKASAVTKVIGGVLARVGRILAPLAFIFAGIDGIRESMKQREESELAGDSEAQKNIETITGFIGGFTGSFIGGFADLIKNSILWVLKKMGLSVDPKTGEFMPGSLLGDFEEFSFAEVIKKGFNWLGDNILKMIDDVVFWIDKMKVKFGLADEETKKRVIERTYMDMTNVETQMANRAVRDMGFESAADLSDAQIKKFAKENTGLGGNYYEGETALINALLRARKRDEELGLGILNKVDFQQPSLAEMKLDSLIANTIRREQVEKEYRDNLNYVNAVDASDNRQTTVNSNPVFTSGAGGPTIMVEGAEYRRY